MSTEFRLLKEFRAGDRVQQAVLLHLQKFGTAVNGKKYARGTVQDNSGAMNFICFNDGVAEEIRNLPNPSVVIAIGQVSRDKYAADGALQMMVEAIQQAGSEVDLSHLIPYTPQNIELYERTLQENIQAIEDHALRQLVAVVLTGDVYKRFVKNPAASKYHHAYIGGLLEHSVDVARLAMAIARETEGIDKDIVMAGALLHDVGKIYEISADVGFSYTETGNLLGHLALGAFVVDRAIAGIPDFPEHQAADLLHILLSHHGSMEKGSPVACATKESFIVHYADELNATLNQFQYREENNGNEWQYNRMLGRQIRLGH
ncbi:MAG: yhaM [Firmicutes bacterium]|nr:yhaM [Bacillota bacterium]